MEFTICVHLFYRDQQRNHRQSSRTTSEELDDGLVGRMVYHLHAAERLLSRILRIHKSIKTDKIIELEKPISICS
uniref:Uncharacterized protein n=1 Tax=Heterorhabditis bacteriophora TaxID=37862 RepID=A0A1I7WB30_HETBA